MSDRLEYKYLSDIKAAQETDGKMRFSGYLAYFGNVDSYGDVIEKGAFLNTLKEARRTGRTIPVLEQHGGWFVNTDMTPIGYYEELKEDDRGLYAEGVLFSTSRGKDTYTALREAPKGAMGQSIGWRPVKTREATEQERRKTGAYRFLEEVELWEGSIVTFPANDKARVEDVKSASLFWRTMEERFRDKGFSREDAKTAVSLVKSSTPDGLFARFLACYGKAVPDNETESGKEAQPFDISGAKALLDVLEDAKTKSEIANFRDILSGFSMR